MRIAVPLLLVLGLVAGASDDETYVFVGKALTVSHDTLEFDRNEVFNSIGFVADPAVLAKLDELKAGDEVRAVFGSTPNPDGRGRINKLLSIRRCEKIDAQCAAELKAQDAMFAEEAKARALFEAKTAQCKLKMEQTLLKDARYIPGTTRVPEIQAQANFRWFDTLTGKRKKCAAAVVADHRKAAHKACELHHCGDQIWGGCWHIVGPSVSDALIERAFAVCKDQ